MKQSQHTTSSELKTTANDVVRWALELRHLHARIAPFFARPEPRHRSLLYLQGILSEVARKNGWQLAEQAGEKRPDGMQRLLTSAVWDEGRVRDELRKYVLERLGDPHAIVAIDETSLGYGNDSYKIGPFRRPFQNRASVQLALFWRLSQHQPSHQLAKLAPPARDRTATLTT